LRECPLRGLTPRAEIEKNSQKVSDSHRNKVSVVNKDLTLKDKSKDCFRLGVLLIQIILVLKPKKVI